MLFQKNLLWIAEFETNNIGPNIQWIKLVNEFEAEYEVYVSQCLRINIFLIPPIKDHK